LRTGDEIDECPAGWGKSKIGKKMQLMEGGNREVDKRENSVKRSEELWAVLWSRIRSRRDYGYPALSSHVYMNVLLSISQ
jgi:hypothetical protein